MPGERTWSSNAKILTTAIGDRRRKSSQVSQRPRDDRQTIKIIGAGLARTGTSSLVVALQRLGFKAYHMFEGVIESGHLQLWFDVAHDFEAMALRLAGGADQSGFDARSRVNASAIAVIDAMAADGFNATTDFPASLFSVPLLHKYPEALVLLTVRSSGSEWATSVLETIAPTSWYLGNVAPFSLLEECRNFWHAHRAVFAYLGAPVENTAGLPLHADLAQSHDDWIEMITRETHPDRLLVHNAAHDGWEKLCNFLVPVFPMVQPPCEAVKASGDPYPHVNDVRTFKTILIMLRMVTVIFWVLPFLLCLLLWRLCVHKKRYRATKLD